MAAKTQDAAGEGECEDCGDRPATECFENGAELCGPCAVERFKGQLSDAGRTAIAAPTGAPVDEMFEDWYERLRRERGVPIGPLESLSNDALQMLLAAYFDKDRAVCQKCADEPEGEKYLRAALTPIVNDAMKRAQVRAQMPELPDSRPFVDAIVQLVEQTPLATPRVQDDSLRAAAQDTWDAFKDFERYPRTVDGDRLKALAALRAALDKPPATPRETAIAAPRETATAHHRKCGLTPEMVAAHYPTSQHQFDECETCRAIHDIAKEALAAHTTGDNTNVH